MNSTGSSSFQDFLKVNKRLGIVFNNEKNFEKIFKYFAEPDTSLINYKKFCQIIFEFYSFERYNKNKYNCNNEKETFNDIIIKKIIEQKSAFTLLELIKNIKIIDSENTNRIFYSDFITALKRTNINLDEEEKSKIYEQCHYFINKNVYYEHMINILLDQFWTEKKNRLCENIFFSLTNNGKKCISINYIQKLFNNEFNKYDFFNFIEQYKLINNNNSSDFITLTEFIKLFKYYNFGNYDSDFLEEINSILSSNVNSNQKDNYSSLKNYFNKSDFNHKKKLHYSRSTDKININKRNDKTNLCKIIHNIKNTFQNYGRISFFNFIKQFKYYETKDNLINRNNFLKVFNNFNIKLTSTDADIIFNKFGIDYSKNYIYYNDFIKYISVNYTNKKREKIIESIYDTLSTRCGKCNLDLNIQDLKDLYNAKNNYFIKEESDNYLEFIDCLDIFHFSYKEIKSDKFAKKEFLEFYRLISFLIEDDNDFIYLISNEWKVDINNNTELDYKNIKKKSNFDMNKNERYFLNDLKNELIKKGVKGLLSLHYKFMTLCSNVDKINMNEFINIFQLEHINFDINEFKDIFNYFSFNSENIYLDYYRFIRFFKKELNDNKLDVVEKIYLSLKNEYYHDNNYEEEEIPLNIIKNKYNAKKHPEVIDGKISENEIIKEFRDSFDINYEIFNCQEKKGKNEKYVDFDMFANFYEYVSFLYSEDNEFINLLVSTWC